MIILNYFIYYFIIIPISLLPFRVLYFLSDVLFFVLYYLVGYRKKVVLENLHNSFPEKSEMEINHIALLFYKHLCDIMVETIKSFTISDKSISLRMILLNPELLNKFFDNEKSIILAGGHYNNWEWIATAIDKQIKHQTIGLYLPLSNLFFDKKMRESRSKFGLILASTRKVKAVFDEYKNHLTATIFAVDQSPGHPGKSYWLKFLNQDTPALFGAEKYAKDYDYPVLYGTINKVKRGHYTFQFSTITEHPRDTAHGYIIETVTKLIEEQIIKEPQYWLWTHRRWKHKRETPESKINIH